MKTKAVFKTASPYMQDAMNLPVENLKEAVPFLRNNHGISGHRRESYLGNGQDAPCQSAILARDDIQIGLAENGGDRSPRFVSVQTVVGLSGATQDEYGCFFDPACDLSQKRGAKGQGI